MTTKLKPLEFPKRVDFFNYLTNGSFFFCPNEEKVKINVDGLLLSKFKSLECFQYVPISYMLP